MVDSPLNWIGGKSQSAQKIVDIMTEHDCYCEVFFGGGWVTFRKKPSKVEIVNDINSELINFYRVIQRQGDKFKEREKYELYSSELYYEYLLDFAIKKAHEEGMKNDDIAIMLKTTVDYVVKIINTHFDEVERAFRFFCLIKEAFGSKFGSGFGFGAVRNNAKAFFNEFKIIDDITLRLKNVVIDNRDFEDVIKSYDGERTLIFTDPPYMNANNADYYFKSSNSSFTVHDHQRLFLALKGIKGKCILTVDDTPWIRERYTKENGFFILENKVFYCSADADNRRHVIELIITNYDTTKIDKHIDNRQSRIEF